MDWAILNGKFIERSKAVVDVEDRGYQFGDGVYEVIRVYNGAMFAVKDHLERLCRSTKSIDINVDYSDEELKILLEELINRNSLKDGIIYLQISRGVSPRSHAFPAERVTPALVAYTKNVDRPADKLETGVNTLLTDDIRWLRCDIKSLNLLGNILAKQKASEKGCYEAIQHRGEEVTEGSSSNVFMVKNGVIVTHESNNLILKGITKDVILRLCEKNMLAFEERAFTLKELSQAEEVFLSSTTAEVMPIVEIDGKLVNGGKPGPVTRKLQKLFVVEIEGQCGKIV